MTGGLLRIPGACDQPRLSGNRSSSGHESVIGRKMTIEKHPSK